MQSGYPERRQQPVDNNNTPQAPQAAAPNIPVQPQPVQEVMSSNGSGGNKILLWFVIGLIVIVAIVGGVYFFLSQQQADTSKESTAVQTPIPSPKEDLEGDLNSIDIDTATESSDFSSVDQDLKNL